jgi:hypothetical protein
MSPYKNTTDEAVYSFQEEISNEAEQFSTESPDSCKKEERFLASYTRDYASGMERHQNFPRINTIFDASSDNPNTILYTGSIRSALRRILPNDLFFSEIKDEQVLQESLQSFHGLLPVVRWYEWGSAPLNLSIFLLCRYRPNAGKFFHDMVSRWLLPGKRLNLSLFFSTDFRLPDLGTEIYSISEIVICLDQDHDIEMIRRNLPIIETEIRLGIISVYHASRILEIKGLSADQKTSLIQEKISALVQRRPADFDYDIFSQMQHFLVMCRNEFKAMRESHHMSRIIYVFYLFRKSLRREVEAFPNKRHLSLKLIKARLHLPLGIKRVLGVFIGMNFLKENEVFEQRHLIRAFQNYIPNVRAVEDSFFVNEGPDDKIHTIYVEVEKENGADFSLEEIKKLRRELPEDLKRRVEHLTLPIFMPRNEEEVMRNIVTLSQQLKYIRDIPQVIISFDEHTDMELCFTVILLRILQPGSLPIQEIFQKAKTRFKFIPDRIKRVGMIRNKYPKEAAVFRVRLPNSSFLRGDHSVDLYKARQELTKELQKIIGEVRDFNGGMISKQNEVFLGLKSQLGDAGEQSEFLLQNFFHSIFPVELRSVLDPGPLKVLFMLFLEMIEKSNINKRRFEYKVEEDSDRLFVMMGLQDFSLKVKIFESIDRLHLYSPQLVSVHLHVFDTIYLGYIYFCDDKAKQEAFVRALQQSFEH